MFCCASVNEGHAKLVGGIHVALRNSQAETMKVKLKFMAYKKEILDEVKICVNDTASRIKDAIFFIGNNTKEKMATDFESVKATLGT
jgi:hypothetical protein